MQVVPLQPVPNQTLQCQLNGQACTINVQQYAYSTVFSLQVSDTDIVDNVPCLNKVVLVRFAYLGFIGDFIFVDTQGSENPVYTGFGANGRFQFVYLTPDEVAEFAAAA